MSGPQAFGQDALAEADGDFHEGRLTHPRRHWTGLKAGASADQRVETRVLGGRSLERVAPFTRQ